MPRVKPSIAITTRDSIANLCALAEAEGSVILFPKSRQDCWNIRNKLYAHRAQLRRSAQQHTGYATSPLDDFKFKFGPIKKCPVPVPPNIHPQSYYFTITREDTVELTIARPRTYYHAPIDDFVFKARP